MPAAKIFTSEHPDVKAAWTIYNKTGSKREVAKQLGITDSKVYRLLSVDEDPSLIELPTFPDEDIPAEEILDHMDKRFQQRLKRDQAMQWFKVKIPDDKPIGLVFVGDPHIGSNGCNVTQLREDVKIMSETEGVMCVNIGDTVDNWPAGYLVRHNWAMSQEELDDGRVVLLARCRGYKWLDDFAKTHGFQNRQYGGSIMFVIVPNQEVPTRRLKAFADLKEGAEYLTWLRKK